MINFIVLSGHLPSIPDWFIIMIFLVGHLIISSIYSLIIWGITRTVSKREINFLPVFLFILIIGVLGLLPMFNFGNGENNSGMLLVSYTPAMVIGSVVGLFFAWKKLVEK